MKIISAMSVIAILLVVGLCWADRQDADAKAAEKEVAINRANARAAAREVEWIDLDKVGRYMTSFDHIKKAPAK